MENKQVAIILVHILYALGDATRDMDVIFNEILANLEDNSEAAVIFQASFKDLMADLEMLGKRIEADVQVLSTPGGFEFVVAEETQQEN